MSLKRIFITQKAPALLETLNEQQLPLWGYMSPQHMVEHLYVWVSMAYSQAEIPLGMPEEQIPTLREMLWSDIPFDKNIVPEGKTEGHLESLIFESYHQALDQLTSSISQFYGYFEQNNGIKKMNPVFGMLDFADWEQYQHKHFSHHLAQFALIPEPVIG